MVVLSSGSSQLTTRKFKWREGSGTVNSFVVPSLMPLVLHRDARSALLKRGFAAAGFFCRVCLFSEMLRGLSHLNDNPIYGLKPRNALRNLERGSLSSGTRLLLVVRAGSETVWRVLGYKNKSVQHHLRIPEGVKRFSDVSAGSTRMRPVCARG